jgi:hypothetical protein
MLGFKLVELVMFMLCFQMVFEGWNFNIFRTPGPNSSPNAWLKCKIKFKRMAEEPRMARLSEP